MTEPRRADVVVHAADGVALAGWWWRQAERAPVVVMAHGFSAVKEMGLELFARAYARAGFNVLVFDHRNLGASGGEPRGAIDPWHQARDYGAALDWVTTRPGVDPSRVALWGTSFSGGEVIACTAIDERVRATVAMVPWCGPGDLVADDRALARRGEAFRAALRGGVAGTAVDLSIAVVSDDATPAVMPQPEAWEWYTTTARAAEGRWANSVSLSGLNTDPPFDPVAAADAIETPVWIGLAAGDAICPPAHAHALARRVRGPVDVHEYPGHHFVLYRPPLADEVMIRTTAFLRSALG